MLKTRIIPTLLLRNESLVKTTQFGKFAYIGDPCNTLRIFNELEVDELLILDIMATRQNRAPNLNLLRDITNECFMPLSYGGGIRTLEDAKAIFKVGFEKVVINSYSVEDPAFISQLTDHFGSQAIVASIDVKRDFWGAKQVFSHGGTKNTKRDPVEWAQQIEQLGAGEILLTSIDQEGTWNGFDIELVKSIADAVSIPVIAHGGAGIVRHIGEVVKKASASAVAIGSIVVFQKKGMGVLINFPDTVELEEVLS